MIVNILSDNTFIQCSTSVENGNNDVQSTTSGSEVETNIIPEATVLAQVAQRCSSKYVLIYIMLKILSTFILVNLKNN